MPFDNIYFPLMIESVTSSPEFSTTIIPTGSGSEQRNGNWQDARVTFNAALGVRSLVDLQRLVSFFRARKGRLRGFIVKDLLDYQANGDVIAIGNGSTSRYQLQRVYSDTVISPFYGATGNADNRPIYKPVGGTVTVYSGITALTQGGYGAKATATITNGAVTALTLNYAGTGYSSNPTVMFVGGGGSGATATATASGGAVTGIALGAGGTGYTSPPRVEIWTSNGDYGIDYRTGVIKLTSNLGNGIALSWSGEFGIPCRFVDDKLNVDEFYYDIVEQKGAGAIPEVGMIETRDYE